MYRVGFLRYELAGKHFRHVVEESTQLRSPVRTVSFTSTDSVFKRIEEMEEGLDPRVTQRRNGNRTSA